MNLTEKMISHFSAEATGILLKKLEGRMNGKTPENAAVKPNPTDPDLIGHSHFTIDTESELSFFEGNQEAIRLEVLRQFSEYLNDWDRVEMDFSITRHPIKKGYPVTEKEIQEDEEQTYGTAIFVVKLFTK